MSSNKEKAARIGRIGEARVCDYLKERGYIIVRRNWHDKRYGEVDIVAENEECIAFVEVKTRAADALVKGAEAVDVNKMRRIKNASAMFMKKFCTQLPPRIDVADVTVNIQDDGTEKFEINYIESAF